MRHMKDFMDMGKIVVDTKRTSNKQNALIARLVEIIEDMRADTEFDASCGDAGGICFGDVASNALEDARALLGERIKYAVFGFDLRGIPHNVDYDVSLQVADAAGESWVQEFGDDARKASYEICPYPSDRFDVLKVCCPNGDLDA